MAEIPIQQKHQRTAWPWLLGLLALVLLTWLFSRREHRSASVHRDTTVSGGAISSPADTSTMPRPR